MKFSSTDINFAKKMDENDELSGFRDCFVIKDPNLIYLDGNSLGRLPKNTVPHLKQTIEEEWGDRLIRGWADDWMNTPYQLGAKIAKLIGAREDEVVVGDATSINLFKLAVAALRAKPDRKKIVSDVFNFPSDLYVLQGVIDLLGNAHQLDLIPSEDLISIKSLDIENTIDKDTALVCLTHIAFKSGFMYDMAEVTRFAHQNNALALWDLSHSVGAVPLFMNDWDVDLAVGCSYKFLNGGPGSPAFLYVRKDLQKEMMQPIWGWFASENPFNFELKFSPAHDISRFRVGTPAILSMKAIEPAIDLLLEAGVARIRAKCNQMSEYLIYLAKEWLLPRGFKLGSPEDPEKRGSHVSLRHPKSEQIVAALQDSISDEKQVIVDFRTPDNIRIGIAPIYNSFTEINEAMNRIRQIVKSKDFTE